MRLWLIILILTPLSLSAQRPNIIFIMSDDHDADAISAYNPSLINTPNIDRLASGGMMFTKCFVGNSICSPARATILTGQHSHMNGVKDNRTRFDSSRMTLPKILHEAGYQTAILGKWHLHSLPTGFDYFKIYPGQGFYYNPRLIHSDNDTVRYSGYSTDIITGETLHWLKEGRDKTKPFFLMMHHKAPHRYFLPKPENLARFTGRNIPEPPDLFADTKERGSAFREQKMSILTDMRLCYDLKIDPDYLMDIPHLKPDQSEIRSYQAIMNSIPGEERNRLKALYAERGKMLKQLRPEGKELLKLKYQWYMQDYLACVTSVDESIGEILDYLKGEGLDQNTVVIYTSDQGFYLGENGWFDKRFIYDVSMQTPLLVMWKGKISPGSINSLLVQNIDFAPTMLDMAGVGSPEWMQGISLLPLLTGQKDKPERKALYYRYYEYPYDHAVLPHLGIREERYKLVYYYTADEWELYDLQLDPREQHNLIRRSDYAGLVEEMKKRLTEIKKLYKDEEPAGTLK